MRKLSNPTTFTPGDVSAPTPNFMDTLREVNPMALGAGALGVGAVGGGALAYLLNRNQNPPPDPEVVTPTEEDEGEMKIANGAFLGPHAATYASWAANMDNVTKAHQLASQNYSDSGMPVRSGIHGVLKELYPLVQASSAKQTTSPLMRWGSDVVAPAAVGQWGNAAVSSAAALMDSKGEHKAQSKELFDKNILKYMEGRDTEAAPPEEVERAMSVTPRTLSAATYTALGDADVATHVRNRNEWPMNYWLNPLVQSGPITELMARLNRRMQAQYANPDTSLRPSLWVPGVAPIRALLSGQDENKEKARALAKGVENYPVKESSVQSLTPPKFDPTHGLPAFNALKGQANGLATPGVAPPSPAEILRLKSNWKQQDSYEQNKAFDIKAPTLPTVPSLIKQNSVKFALGEETLGAAKNFLTNNFVNPAKELVQPHINQMADTAAQHAKGNFLTDMRNANPWMDWAAGGAAAGAGLGLAKGLAGRKKDKWKAIHDALGGAALGGIAGGGGRAAYDMLPSMYTNDKPPAEPTPPPVLTNQPAAKGLEDGFWERRLRPQSKIDASKALGEAEGLTQKVVGSTWDGSPASQLLRKSLADYDLAVGGGSGVPAAAGKLTDTLAATGANSDALGAIGGGAFTTSPAPSTLSPEEAARVTPGLKEQTYGMMGSKSRMAKTDSPLAADLAKINPEDLQASGVMDSPALWNTGAGLGGVGAYRLGLNKLLPKVNDATHLDGGGEVNTLRRLGQYGPEAQRGGWFSRRIGMGQTPFNTVGELDNAAVNNIAVRSSSPTILGKDFAIGTVPVTPNQVSQYLTGNRGGLPPAVQRQIAQALKAENGRSLQSMFAGNPTLSQEAATTLAGTGGSAAVVSKLKDDVSKLEEQLAKAKEVQSKMAPKPTTTSDPVVATSSTTPKPGPTTRTVLSSPPMMASPSVVPPTRGIAGTVMSSDPTIPSPASVTTSAPTAAPTSMFTQTPTAAKVTTTTPTVKTDPKVLKKMLETEAELSLKRQQLEAAMAAAKREQERILKNLSPSTAIDPRTVRSYNAWSPIKNRVGRGTFGTATGSSPFATIAQTLAAVAASNGLNLGGHVQNQFTR